MARKHSPGCLCCDTDCDTTCASVDPLTTVTVAIANGEANNSFDADFPASDNFDCTTTATTCVILTPSKVVDANCTTDWGITDAAGINCNCGNCNYVPEDPDDPIPFPTPPGDPFPATTFTRVSVSTRIGYRVCCWRQKGYRVEVVITEGATPGKVRVTVYYQIGFTDFWNFLRGIQQRYRILTYDCPGGPSPSGTGSWVEGASPFPLAEPPYPCIWTDPVTVMADCSSTTRGTPVAAAPTIATAGQDQTLACDPVNCAYIVTNDPVPYFSTPMIQSKCLNSCSPAVQAATGCDTLIPTLSIPSACETFIYFDLLGSHYLETIVYQSEEIDCTDLRDGAITLSRLDGTTSNETYNLWDSFDYECGDSLNGWVCADGVTFDFTLPAITITVPWQVTVTFA